MWGKVRVCVGWREGGRVEDAEVIIRGVAACLWLWLLRARLHKIECSVHFFFLSQHTRGVVDVKSASRKVTCDTLRIIEN